MNLFRQHPATRQLLRQQSLARLHHMLYSFRTPRRALLSLIAVVLAMVWISQAVAGVFFRESADPLRLHRWLTLGMTGFALWNFVKIVFRQPVEPLEWTPAEKEWLGGSPLSRGHLVRYRLAAISGAALFKAAIFVGVMIPDLHVLAAAFAGLYLGLMAIELLRMAMEMVAWSMTRRQRRILQFVVATGLMLVIAAIIFWYVDQWRAGQFRQVVSLAMLQCTREGLQLVPQTAWGAVLCAPFGVLADVILANRLDGSLAVRLLASLTTMALLVRALEITDRVTHAVRNHRERQAWRSGLHVARRQARRTDTTRRLRAPRGGVIGALVWRQFGGLRHYLGTVLFSLAVPMLFALGPAFGPQQGWQLVQTLVLLLGFWSFFLLPSALKFDFRRDLNRMNVLKALPARPWQIVIAQLVVPVTATSVFQLATLLAAMIINPFPPGLLVVAMAVLLPFNLFIYALENIVFLLYPYRLSEESIRVFLRTILAFTAKGIVLGAVAGAGLSLLLASVLVCRTVSVPNSESVSLIVFATASLFLGLAASYGVVVLLARIFDRLDPSSDLSTTDG
jgi:hypothetical protein